MDKVRITIDSKQITVSKDQTILQAALAHKIYIPHLCYHPDLEPVAVCRLCIVEVAGKGLVTSCNKEVEDGLVVKTTSDEINRTRCINAELLIANHHIECMDNFTETGCQLKQIADFLGIKSQRIRRLRADSTKRPLDTSNPFFNRDPNQCVLCGICVRTCDKLQCVRAIDFINRGYNTKIGTFADRPIEASICESCGECVSRCPTGALSLKKKRQKPEKSVRTTCPYCGVGCGMYLEMKGNKVVGVSGDTENPVNKGSLCVKGRFGYDFISHPQRLDTPLVKKKGKFVSVNWKQALEVIAESFAKYKGNSFAALSSAKCTNEDNYIIQKFVRVVMGTNNIDHCARLCHAPTVVGLAQSFGSGAMTNSINEISSAKCILAIGTNTTAAHPVIGMKVKKAAVEGAKLIVANPKEIDLCRYAHMFLQQRPGTDVALMMGMMKVIVDERLHDSEFIDQSCENFAAFRNSLDDFKIGFVERVTGVDGALIEEAARIYAKNSPASILYAMGITQHTHGTDNVLATSNLALLTGNIGRPSSGVNPLRGQNNVQGACDLGALPNVYSGYQKVAIPEMRKKFESSWGVNLPAQNGLTHVEIFDAICEGKIKAMYIVGENPVLSEANASHVKDALKKLKFLVVQDIFLSQTAKYADVVLPAACFAEKEGTFTNTERRVQRVRKAVNPPGSAKADWQITCNLANKIGACGFEFSSAKEVMQEIAAVTPSYAGISYERIEDIGLQWPCKDQKHPGTEFLHQGRFATASGKGKFMPLKYRPSAELPDKKYPLILTTDRSIFHFHTSTMTRRVAGLDILNGQELLTINPQDASKLKISEGETVEISSRRGRVKAKAKLTDICPSGVVSMTFHFAQTPTNTLTNSALDPVAKIPETKVCAVRVRKIKR